MVGTGTLSIILLIPVSVTPTGMRRVSVAAAREMKEWLRQEPGADTGIMRPVDAFDIEKKEKLQ